MIDSPRSEQVHQDKFDLTKSICNHKPWDLPTSLELNLVASYQALQTDLNISDYTSEGEQLQMLQTRVSSDETAQNNTIAGLFYGCLLEENNFEQYFHWLTNVVRDNYSFVCCQIENLVLASYEELKRKTWERLLLLVEKLIEYRIACLPNTFLLLWRVTPACRHAQNIQIFIDLIGIFKRNIKWVLSVSAFGSHIFFKCIRMLIEFGHLVEFEDIKSEVIKLIQQLWTNNQSECLKSQQELFRILPFCSKIPGIEEILKELKSIKGEKYDTFFEEMMTSRQYEGLHNSYVACCLDINIQRKLEHIILNVNPKNAPRYVQWIFNKLNCEDQMIFGDIIRYLVTNIHPSNEQLRKDTTKRWEVINHLLVSTTDILAFSYSLSSLIYDWHFYKRDEDKIMLVEPGMLVIYNNLRARQQYKNYIKFYDENQNCPSTQEHYIGDYLLRFMKESASVFLAGHKEKFMKSFREAFLECEKVSVIPIPIKELYKPGKYNNSEIAGKLIYEIMEKYEEVDSEMSLPNHIDMQDVDDNDTENDHLVKEESKVTNAKRKEHNNVKSTEEKPEKANTKRLFNSSQEMKSESHDSEDNLFSKSENDSEEDKDQVMEEEEIMLSNISSVNEDFKNKENDISDLISEILATASLKHYSKLYTSLKNMLDKREDLSFSTIFKTSNQLEYLGDEESISVDDKEMIRKLSQIFHKLLFHEYTLKREILEKPFKNFTLLAEYILNTSLLGSRSKMAMLYLFKYLNEESPVYSGLVVSQAFRDVYSRLSELGINPAVELTNRLNFYESYKKILRMEKEYNLIKEIINDCIKLEDYQFDEIVEHIVQLLPFFYPSEILDNEDYFWILMRNINSDSIQHICYCLQTQKYSLVNNLVYSFIRKSLSLPKICQINFWKIINSQKISSFTLIGIDKKQLFKEITKIVSEWKNEAQVAVLCTEVAPLLQLFVKEMMSKKDPLLFDSICELFLCLRPSKSYILMICHVFEILPIPVLQKVIEEGMKQVEEGNHIFKSCLDLYKKSLEMDREYNGPILKLFK